MKNVPLTGQTHVIADNSGAGYDIIGNTQTEWVVTALDADGNIIAGDGAPLFTLTVPGAAFVTGTTAMTNVYSITAAIAEPTQVSIGISATGLGPSGVTSSPGSVAILPMQELWMTASATLNTSSNGIFGFQLNPNPAVPGTGGISGPAYGPPSEMAITYRSCNGYLHERRYYGPIAQDSSGVLWVYTEHRQRHRAVHAIQFEQCAHPRQRKHFHNRTRHQRARYRLQWFSLRHRRGHQST